MPNIHDAGTSLWVFAECLYATLPAFLRKLMPWSAQDATPAPAGSRGRTSQEKRLQSGRAAARLWRNGVAPGVTPKIGCPPT